MSRNGRWNAARGDKAYFILRNGGLSNDLPANSPEFGKPEIFDQTAYRRQSPQPKGTSKHARTMRISSRRQTLMYLAAVA